jgi:Tfp pilus assembly protein PilN
MPTNKPSSSSASTPARRRSLRATLPRTGDHSLAATVADALTRLQLAERSRMLSRLVGSVGVLALAVVGGGVFARYASAARESGVIVSLEDAARATKWQLYELVRYVQQSDPALLRSIRAELTRTLG